MTNITKGIAIFQIGKNGLTNGTIELLRKAFITRTAIKISVLKSAGHERDKVREMADNIAKALGKFYTAKVIGFTIILKKWRKVPKSNLN